MEEYSDFFTILYDNNLCIVCGSQFLALLGTFDIYMNISDEMAANHSTFNNVYDVPCSIVYSISVLFLIRIISYFILSVAEKQVNILLFSHGINNNQQC